MINILGDSNPEGEQLIQLKSKDLDNDKVNAIIDFVKNESDLLKRFISSTEQSISLNQKLFDAIASTLQNFQQKFEKIEDDNYLELIEQHSEMLTILTNSITNLSEITNMLSEKDN